MTKKIVFVVALILAAGIGGWLFYSQQQEVITTVEPVTSTVVKKTEKPEKTAEEHFDLYDDELSNETRIILATPDDQELDNLLSHKVIRNDEIVDKTNSN